MRLLDKFAFKFFKRWGDKHKLATHKTFTFSWKYLNSYILMTGEVYF